MIRKLDCPTIYSGSAAAQHHREARRSRPLEGDLLRRHLLTIHPLRFPRLRRRPHVVHQEPRRGREQQGIPQVLNMSCFMYWGYNSKTKHPTQPEAYFMLWTFLTASYWKYQQSSRKSVVVWRLFRSYLTVRSRILNSMERSLFSYFGGIGIEWRERFA